MKNSHLLVKPASRTNDIKYAIRDVVVLADMVAKEGKEMAYLNIGDPLQFDFKTPPHIIEATYHAMLANHTGYSPSAGVDEALEAVRKEAERKGIGNILDVFITTGSSEAIDLSLTALVDPGENVLLPSPCYPLYTAVLSKLGAEASPYYLDEENNWQLDIADIVSRVNDKTRAIVIANPNNPTGALYAEETLRRLVDVALEHNLVILSDEIYSKLVFDNKRHVSIASLSKDASVITFDGLSKAYLATGFRLGWGVVSGEENSLHDYCEAIRKLCRARLCANHPEQYAVKPALEGDQSHLSEVMEKLARRRNLTVEMLNSIDGISCVRPEGAFYVFPRLHIDDSDEHFVSELLRETGVVTVPGSGFGQKPGTKHFRVVFLAPEETLEEAYRKIADFMVRHRQGL